MTEKMKQEPISMDTVVEQMEKHSKSLVSMQDFMQNLQDKKDISFLLAAYAKAEYEATKQMIEMLETVEDGITGVDEAVDMIEGRTVGTIKQLTYLNHPKSRELINMTN